MNDQAVLDAIDAAITDDDGSDDEQLITFIAQLLGERLPAGYR